MIKSKEALMTAVIGALKSAINDHGPVTLDLTHSAAKRVVGMAQGLRRAVWLPIDTAPEGEDVLVFVPGFNEEYQRMVCHKLDGDWFQQDADACPDPLDEAPTLWMSLPDRPLPTTRELAGSCPDITDGMSTTEYIAHIRGHNDV